LILPTANKSNLIGRPLRLCTPYASGLFRTTAIFSMLTCATFADGKHAHRIGIVKFLQDLLFTRILF